MLTASYARAQLVLIPGLLCTETLFAPQIDALSDIADFFIPDHSGPDTMSDLATSVLANAPERFVLGGLSMGGYIAFEVLRQAPARVSGLILMDTNARADRDAQKEDRRRAIEIGQRKGLDPVLDAFVPMMVYPDRLDDEALMRTIRTMGHETGVDSYVRQQTAIMERRDNRAFLAEITCPALVIVGAQDVVTPVKVAQEMAEGIAGARLEVIPECGHLPTLEKSNVVSELIRTFLEEV